MTRRQTTGASTSIPSFQSFGAWVDFSVGDLYAIGVFDRSLAMHRAKSDAAILTHLPPRMRYKPGVGRFRAVGVFSIGLAHRAGCFGVRYIPVETLLPR